MDKRSNFTLLMSVPPPRQAQLSISYREEWELKGVQYSNYLEGCSRGWFLFTSLGVLDGRWHSLHSWGWIRKTKSGRWFVELAQLGTIRKRRQNKSSPSGGRERRGRCGWCSSFSEGCLKDWYAPPLMWGGNGELAYFARLAADKQRQEVACICAENLQCSR